MNVVSPFIGAHFKYKIKQLYIYKSKSQNLLRYRDKQTAILFKGEDRDVVRMSYAHLYDEVARVARSLRMLGIKPGDCVAGFMPNLPQAIIAMLAATSIGATWSSCSPGCGTLLDILICRYIPIKEPNRVIYN